MTAFRPIIAKQLIAATIYILHATTISTVCYLRSMNGLTGRLRSRYPTVRARTRTRFKKGVRQGCVLFPYLFNILAEMDLKVDYKLEGK